MKLSIINLALGAIILVGMSACTQQERVATEHSVAIVDSVQQIVAEEVLARVNRTESEWGIGILMDTHSGTVVAMYDTDSTLCHAQSAWEMGSIVSPLALLAAYSVNPQGWDSVVGGIETVLSMRGAGFMTDTRATLFIRCPMPSPQATIPRLCSMCFVFLNSNRYCCRIY